MHARTLLLVPFLLLLAVPAGAGEPRTIELPRQGLSVEVPADWTVVQPFDALVELRQGPHAVWIRRYESPAPQPPVRTWSPWEAGGAEGRQCLARIARDGTSVFEVEARVPDESGQEIVDALLDSIDTTPYAYATRYVDWAGGWTLTLPEAWKRMPAGKQTGVTFQATEGRAWIGVDDLATLMRASGGATDVRRDPDAWAEFAWQEALRRLQDAEGLTSEEPPVVETVKRGDAEGRRMHLGLDLDDEERPRAWLHVLVLDGMRVLAFVREDGGAAHDEVREAVDSFRRGTHPGPRAGGTAPTDRFPGHHGPDVVFALPEGWTTTPGTNRMRLAQVQMGEAEGIDAVVFFFGAGGGGAVDDNIARWRQQMGTEDGGTVTTHEPVEGVTITLLDVTGAYQTSSMNPHGPDPHGGDDSGEAGTRMLGAVIELPGGPLFVKVTGPAEAVGAQADDVKRWLLSFRPVL